MNNPYQTPNAAIGDGGLLPCVGCGRDIHQTAARCTQCGASQRTTRYKSKTAAALLAFFVGGFGIHRFYLGQWWGLFYLLFFWLWIPNLIALIEFIVFLLSDEKTWDVKYNEGKYRAPGEGGGGIAVAIILGVLFMVVIVGILAAIALPAYKNYTLRSETSMVLIEVSPIKRSVEDFVEKHEMLPDSNIMLQLDEPHHKTPSGHEIVVSPQGIEVTIRSDSTQIDGHTIMFVPLQAFDRLTWDCTGGTLVSLYRMSTCKQD